MEAVAYARVSSKAQDHKSQRTELERVAKARGDTIAFWYAEKMSGASTARPALEQLSAAKETPPESRAHVANCGEGDRATSVFGVGGPWIVALLLGAHDRCASLGSPSHRSASEPCDEFS